ncbi:hypothetical protein OIU79_017858 [Salix purpurea]|uniref:Uncharacterized protein n=1 Tax=Salix purpurea TaxID=77065 RepID=A0A9Q0WW16_SALPP|nr:hypothetical protein OIU79_017858 [Salix purpurea]
MGVCGCCYCGEFISQEMRATHCIVRWIIVMGGLSGEPFFLLHSRFVAAKGLKNGWTSFGIFMPSRITNNTFAVSASSHYNGLGKTEVFPH